MNQISQLLSPEFPKNGRAEMDRLSPVPKLDSGLMSKPTVIMVTRWPQNILHWRQAASCQCQRTFKEKNPFLIGCHRKTVE